MSAAAGTGEESKVRANASSSSSSTSFHYPNEEFLVKISSKVQRLLHQPYGQIDRGEIPDVVDARCQMEDLLLKQVGDSVIHGSDCEIPTNIDLCAAPKETTDDATTTTAGDEEGRQKAVENLYALPLSSEAVESLYWRGADAPLGVESKGNIVDHSLRKTKEFKIKRSGPHASGAKLHHLADDTADECPEIELDDFFQDLGGTLHNTEIKKRIHHTLCPTSQQAALVPYKLLVYKPGDFFRPHVDSLHNSHQFGTLSVEIPVQSDALELDESETEHMQSYNIEQAAGSAKHWNALDTNYEDRYLDQTCGHRRGGDLVFFPGHGVDPISVPSSAPGTTSVVSMHQSMDPEALKEMEKALIANRQEDKLYNQPGDDYQADTVRIQLTTDRPSPSHEEVKKDPKKKVFRVKYAAWLSETLHAVEPVKRGMRVVIVYLLLSKGIQFPKVPLPIVDQVTSQYRKIISTLGNVANSNTSKSTQGKLQPFHLAYVADHYGIPLKGSHTDGKKVALPNGEEMPTIDRIKYVGFTLRHVYPRGQLAQCFPEYWGAERDRFIAEKLSDPANNFSLEEIKAMDGYKALNNRRAENPLKFLKGIDAILYHIMSMQFECNVYFASWTRRGEFGMPFLRRDRNETLEQVALAENMPFDEDPEHARHVGSEDYYSDMTQHNRSFLGVLWCRLGCGNVAAGGFSYGNADCGTDWWYRNAVMVVTHRKSGWQRKKYLFLVCDKSPLPVRQLKDVFDVFEYTAGFL